MIAIDGARITWTGDGETVVVEPWGDSSARVRAVPFGRVRECDLALLDPPGAEARAGRTTDGAELVVGALRVVLTESHDVDESRRRPVHRCHLGFFDRAGRQLVEELPSSGALRLRARDFSSHDGGGFGLRASFVSDPGEHLVGMGGYEQALPDLKGAVLELAQRNSQVSVPFVVSSAGYGFLWHNPAIGQVSFATNRTVWESRSTGQLDYWVTAGETPAEILRHYADATGHAPHFPEWAAGLWQSKLRYWNQEQLLDVAREFARRELPLDVIVADFFHWPHMGDYRFEEEFWPDPAAMVAELHSLGVELMVSVWPQVSLDSENFEEMSDRNLLLRTNRGMDAQMSFQGPSMFVDVTNPGARRFLWEACRRNYGSAGVRMYWLDEAEPEFGTYDVELYDSHLGPMLQVGNAYPQLYARAFHDGQRADGQTDVVNLARCAWAGSQRYGVVVWSGDIHSGWADLANQIPLGIHLGMAGIPWFTTDIGGFAGGDIGDPGFHELLVRWFQFGTFCPVMRAHGDRLPFEDVVARDGSPRLRSGAANEPWAFGGATSGVVGHCIRLREVLRPDVARAMAQAQRDGLPVMRGVFVEFPSDERSWSIGDEFLLGSDLLVCPVVTAGATSRRVYLPEGATWTDLRDGVRYEGGRWIDADAPLESIPVFGRSGAGRHLMGRIQAS